MRWWWLRLHVWQWTNAWRLHPLRSASAAAAWWLPAVLLPAGFALRGPFHAAAALRWLLSFDVPLALVLSALTCSGVLALRSRRKETAWLPPTAQRGAAAWALPAMRISRAVRWPITLGTATLVLAMTSGDRSPVAELLLIALLGLAGGLAMAWMLAGPQPLPEDRSDSSRARGLAALSWAPLRETHRVLSLRRLGTLALPVLLAAPMGAAAQQVAKVLALWLPLLYLATLFRQARHIGAQVRAWMPLGQLPTARLLWWTWRLVALASLGCGLVLWLGTHFLLPKGADGNP